MTKRAILIKSVANKYAASAGTTQRFLQVAALPCEEGPMGGYSMVENSL